MYRYRLSKPHEKSSIKKAGSLFCPLLDEGIEAIALLVQILKTLLLKTTCVTDEHLDTCETSKSQICTSFWLAQYN